MSAITYLLRRLTIQVRALKGPNSSLLNICHVPRTRTEALTTALRALSCRCGWLWTYSLPKGQPTGNQPSLGHFGVLLVWGSDQFKIQHWPTLNEPSFFCFGQTPQARRRNPEVSATHSSEPCKEDMSAIGLSSPGLQPLAPLRKHREPLQNLQKGCCTFEHPIVFPNTRSRKQSFPQELIINRVDLISLAHGSKCGSW